MTNKKAIFLTVLAGTMLSLPLYAWEDCPFGLVNDRYPGKCGLYEDANHDSICDHSQKNPFLLATAPDTPAQPLAVTAKPRERRNTVPRIAVVSANGAAISIPSHASNDAALKTIPDPIPRSPSPLRQRYPLWQIFLLTAVLASVTEALSARNKKLTLPLQAAWNWALGLSFLLTFASSLAFVYPALLKKVNFNISYWHSLTGLVMIAIGLYHIIRRFGSMRRGLFAWFRATGSNRRNKS